MNETYILLVEDNEDDVVLTRRAFQKCQIPQALKVVWDGQEALDFIFEQGKYAHRDPASLPSLVILDLKLPYVGGVEILRRIRADQTTSRLPVVVLSSSVYQQDVEDCESLGINGYYRKPANFEEFKKIINEIRSSWENPPATNNRLN